MIAAVLGVVFLPKPLVALEPAAMLPIELVDIPPGTFVMGARDDGDDGLYPEVGYGAADELPRHEVALSAYRIGKYHVTNAQYAAVLNWALQQGRLRDSSGNPWAGAGDLYAGGPPAQVILTLTDPYCNIEYADGEFIVKTRAGLPEKAIYSMDTHPVVSVSWYGCVAFCNWLSEMEARPPCYDLSTWTLTLPPPLLGGYRLPTEAEWERAAAWDGAKHWIYGYTSDTMAEKDRWNTRYEFSNPDIINPLFCTNPLGLAGFPDVSFTTPVGWFNGVNISPNGNIATIDSPSPVGCYDMSGNAWQWVHDWYGAYTEEPSINPTGPETGTMRAIRGGGWRTNRMCCRTARRISYTPEDTWHDIGLRVAMSAPDNPGEGEGEGEEPLPPGCIGGTTGGRPKTGNLASLFLCAIILGGTALKNRRRRQSASRQEN